MQASFKNLFSVLTSRETYDLRLNMYALFGFLWGLPIPVMALGLSLYLLQLPPTLSNVYSLLVKNPIHIFFIAHPVLFMVVFGALGTYRRRKEAELAERDTRLHQKVNELNDANKQLRALDKLKDEFLANVTHELRTPLVTIRGYTEMFLNGRMGEITSKQERSLRIVERNVHRLLKLIGDILTLSRLERRQVLDNQQTFSLAELINHVAANIGPSVEQHNLNLEVDMHDPECSVVGLRDRIEQVFLNLISNAIKFTGSGGAIKIITGPLSSERIQIEVEDTGCGIPEQNLPYIFERFVQGDGSIRRRHGGAGLGLSIVREILEAHDCSIRVRSTEGQGTCFTFDLPLVDPTVENLSKNNA